MRDEEHSAQPDPRASGSAGRRFAAHQTADRACCGWRTATCSAQVFLARRQRAILAEMSVVLAMTAHTGRDLAEVGFLLLVLSGVWLAASQIPRLRLPAARTALAGIALAIGGVLLIIPTHWGHFG
jgi:hypothetical protein